MDKTAIIEFLLKDHLVKDYLAQDKIIDILKAKVERLEHELYYEACRVVTLEEVIENFYEHAEVPVRRDLMAEFNAVDDAVEVIEHFGWSSDSGSETEWESENLLTP
jgi:hypothetical protein